jgi:hypothetical protein
MRQIGFVFNWVPRWILIRERGDHLGALIDASRVIIFRVEKR